MENTEKVGFFFSTTMCNSDNGTVSIIRLEIIVFQLNTEFIKVEPISEERTSSSSLTEVNFIDMKDPLLLMSPFLKVENNVSFIFVRYLILSVKFVCC